MNQLTRAQLTVGLLAYFATLWSMIQNLDFSNIPIAVGLIILQLVLLLILSYVILAILEWVNIFDLKTNSIMTLLVLVTIRILVVL